MHCLHSNHVRFHHLSIQSHGCEHNSVCKCIESSRCLASRAFVSHRLSKQLLSYLFFCKVFQGCEIMLERSAKLRKSFDRILNSIQSFSVEEVKNYPCRTQPGKLILKARQICADTKWKFR